MKMLITNGPREGEVVEVPDSASEWVLLDPPKPEPISVEPVEVSSVTTNARRYVRGRIAREQATEFMVMYGAQGIIYDPVQAKADAREHSIRQARQDRYAAMDPEERYATAIEESAIWHDHCESCEQDDEYPCCRAYSVAEQHFSTTR